MTQLDHVRERPMSITENPEVADPEADALFGRYHEQRSTRPSDSPCRKTQPICQKTTDRPNHNRTGLLGGGNGVHARDAGV